MSGRLTNRRFAEAGARRLLRDTAVIMRYTAGAKNAYQTEGLATYPDDPAPIAVSYLPGAEEEGQDTIMNVPVDQGQMLLPLGTRITSQDRIRLTARNGRALPVPMTFQVIGAPQQEPGTVRVGLQFIPTHS